MEPMFINHLSGSYIISFNAHNTSIQNYHCPNFKYRHRDIELGNKLPQSHNRVSFGTQVCLTWLLFSFYYIFLAPRDTRTFLTLQHRKRSIFLAIDMDIKMFYPLFKITNKIVGESPKGGKNKIPVRLGELMWLCLHIVLTMFIQLSTSEYSKTRGVGLSRRRSLLGKINSSAM